MKEEEDVCMQVDKLLDNSPAENTEKVALSPLTWINPASDTVNAHNSGLPNAEESSREQSHAERSNQKDGVSA